MAVRDGLSPIMKKLARGDERGGVLLSISVLLNEFKLPAVPLLGWLPRSRKKRRELPQILRNLSPNLQSTFFGGEDGWIQTPPFALRPTRRSAAAGQRLGHAVKGDNRLKRLPLAN